MDIDEKQLKDEQELAKVLAGINDQPTAQPANSVATNTPGQTDTDSDSEAALKNIAGAKLPGEKSDKETKPEAPTGAPKPNDSGNLDNILKSAINDLRPLVDKLNIPATEKFDTYLLLIRSTDDKSLIEPAYQTAKQIADEAKRAEALLNIVKEINYFSSSKQNPQR